MMLLNRDSAIQSASRRFCTVYKSKKSDPLQPSGRRDIPSGRPSVQSIFCPNDENLLSVRTFLYVEKLRTDAHLSKASSVRTTKTYFPSGPSSMSRSFELLQLASVQTFQQHVQTTLSVRPAMEFFSQTQIWEDRCNCPNDVDSRPDALIHKASITFKIQTSGR